MSRWMRPLGELGQRRCRYVAVINGRDYLIERSDRGRGWDAFAIVDGEWRGIGENLRTMSAANECCSKYAEDEHGARREPT